MSGRRVNVRWGFLGAGWIASRALAPAVHAAHGAELAAVAARDPARARALAPRAVYPSYQQLLAAPDVDAVYVALANDAHRPWTEAALAAGKHVLCEKPLGLTATEVGSMQAAAERAGRLLVEAGWYRWHPRTRRAEELVRDGAVGEVRHVGAGFTFAGVAADNYRLDPRRGGGAGYDVGCYPVSAALWAVAAPVRRVRAEGAYGPTGVDLSTALFVDFAGGATATLRCSIALPERQWLRIVGTRGVVELEAPSFTAYRRPCELTVATATATWRESFPAEDAYRLMVEAVSGKAAGGRGWVLPAAQSLAAAQVLDAARSSAAGGGRWVEVASP